jgi:hypothetical protein
MRRYPAIAEYWARLQDASNNAEVGGVVHLEYRDCKGSARGQRIRTQHCSSCVVHGILAGHVPMRLGGCHAARLFPASSVIPHASTQDRYLLRPAIVMPVCDLCDRRLSQALVTSRLSEVHLGHFPAEMSSITPTISLRSAIQQQRPD